MESLSSTRNNQLASVPSSIWIDDHHYNKLRFDEASSLDLQGTDLICQPIASSIFETIDSGSDEGLSAIFSSSKVTHRLCDSVTFSSVESACNNSSEVVSKSGMAGTAKRKLEDYEKTGGGYQISFSKNDDQLGARKLQRSDHKSSIVPCRINFSQENCYEIDTEAIAQVKEMIYRAAALRPITSIGILEEGGGDDQRPKRKNVRISSDPQTVAARQRRERISDRLRILQNIVPGGSKMDTATMLDEAANYLKFLKSQIKILEALGN